MTTEDLHVAIHARDLDAVAQLLWRGADPSKQIFGMNAYHAAATSTPEIMQLLLKHEKRAHAFDFCIIDRREADPLRLAIEKSDVEMVKLLLDFGLGVNNRDNDNETPLHYALTHRKSRDAGMPVLRLLIDRGADLDAKALNFWDDTPLMLAVRDGYTEAVKLLLDHGADAGRVNHADETMLHLNAGTWNAEITQMLIDAGTPLESKDRHGRTALHIAAHHNKLEVVKTLLAAGADPYALDNKKQIPSDLCLGDFQKNTRRELLHKEMELAAIKTYGPHDKYVKRDDNPRVNRPSQTNRFRR